MAMATNEEDFSHMDIPSPSESLLNELQQLDETGESLPDFHNLTSLLDSIPVGFSPEFNPNSASQDQSDTIPQTAAFPPGIQPRSNRLEIIAQPCYTSKLRTREDCERENRRHTLKAKNKNSPYTSPTIRIPPSYLNSAEQYYIGVFTVTVIHEKSDCRYFHPYELEDVENKDRNEKDVGVWYPIGNDESEGIKSFPNIRIVLRKEQDLSKYGPLRVFYGYTLDANLLDNAVPEIISGRKMVQEYNLKRIQLAFMIGKKMNAEDSFPTIRLPHLTVFSDEMVEHDGKEKVEDKKSIQSVTPPPDCRMYKYAPRRGDTEGMEEVLIFYTKKLEENKYGNLKIIFEWNTPTIKWSALVAADDIEIKDRMVSFKTPCFPFSIIELTPVNIILQQEKRMLEKLQYFYVPKLQCSTCQANMMTANMMTTSNPAPRNNPNKRSKFLNQTDDETDAVVPMSESKPVIRPPKSEPESHSSNSTSQSSNKTNQTYCGANEQLIDKLEEGTISLFNDNDLKPLLLICHPFIKKCPELLQTAINNNHSDLISKFIPIARINLLQQKNPLGETVLLQAARLNRVTIVKTLLEKENSVKLLDDVNDKEQNIFHILAINTDLEEILDLLIHHLREKSINIQEKFDLVDKDNRTPLQLAISNNNLPATRYFLNYFNKNVCDTNNGTGDNLIHLAVRHSDLTMFKYLLNEGNLSEQGTQTNLKMTPIELARSIKRDDMVEYLNELYPQPEFDEDESSDEDEGSEED